MRLGEASVTECPKGLCFGHDDPELWFPESNIEARAGKEICQRCPIQIQCLSTALMAGEHWGTWGDKTAWERALMLRHQRDNRRLGLLTRVV